MEMNACECILDMHIKYMVEFASCIQRDAITVNWRYFSGLAFWLCKLCLELVRFDDYRKWLN